MCGQSGTVDNTRAAACPPRSASRAAVSQRAGDSGVGPVTRTRSFHSDQGVWPSRMRLALSRSVTLLGGELRQFQATAQKQARPGHCHVAFIQDRVQLRAEDRHSAVTLTPLLNRNLASDTKLYEKGVCSIKCQHYLKSREWRPRPTVLRVPGEGGTEGGD